jgi:hypothetical protein
LGHRQTLNAPGSLWQQTASQETDLLAGNSTVPRM